MTAAAKTVEQTDAYFAAVEDAVMQTPRGRWFLAEYARRCRAFESQRILDAISRIDERLGEEREHAQIDILRRELQEMSSAIVQTRREIAAMRPEDHGSNRIMAATEELDAIVTATERATSEILGAAEKIQALATQLRESATEHSAEQADALDGVATEIFLACSFQDITGQRTTKVVNVLRYLEQRVNSMIEIWGVTEKDGEDTEPITKDTRPDAHLLNGPQKEGEGVSQADVDALFGGDTPATVNQDEIDNLFP